MRTQHRPPPQPRTSLTPREKAVLRLLTCDMTAKRIAAHLGISTRTVDRHLGSARKKTGTKTIQGLAVYAVREGVIP